MEVTVYSKKELDDAYALGARRITVKGEFAQQIRTRCKLKKASRITAGLIAVAGIAAAPFTGGTSLLATGVGLTAGPITISTMELAMIIGGGLAHTALKEGKLKTISYGQDGSVIMEFKTE